LTQSLTIAMLLFVSAGALVVLLWPHHIRDLLHSLAQLPLLALICCAWSILCAAIARRSGSSPHGCRNLAAGPFLAACILLWLVTLNASFGAFSPFSWAVGLFCRKLVYPDLAGNGPDVKSSRSLGTRTLNP
jgi:membrane-bound metal-dependent hydrolase YbcI (DUF457 family)